MSVPAVVGTTQKVTLPVFDGGDLPDLLKKIYKTGCVVSGEALSILKQLVYAPGRAESDVVVLKAVDFRVDKRRILDIRHSAQNQGMQDVKPIQAAFLPLACSRSFVQEMGIVTLVAVHTAVLTSSGRHCFLGLSFSGKAPELFAYDANPANEWDPKVGFVFRAPRS